MGLEAAAVPAPNRLVASPFLRPPAGGGRLHQGGAGRHRGPARGSLSRDARPHPGGGPVRAAAVSRGRGPDEQPLLTRSRASPCLPAPPHLALSPPLVPCSFQRFYYYTRTEEGQQYAVRGRETAGCPQQQRRQGGLRGAELRLLQLPPPAAPCPPRCPQVHCRRAVPAGAAPPTEADTMDASVPGEGCGCTSPYSQGHQPGAAPACTRLLFPARKLNPSDCQCDALPTRHNNHRGGAAGRERGGQGPRLLHGGRLHREPRPHVR